MSHPAETCNNCGAPAKWQLNCGHYLCGLCDARGRDDCNRAIRYWDEDRWVAVEVARRMT